MLEVDIPKTQHKYNKWQKNSGANTIHFLPDSKFGYFWVGWLIWFSKSLLCIFHSDTFESTKVALPILEPEFLCRLLYVVFLECLDILNSSPISSNGFLIPCSAANINLYYARSGCETK